MELAACVLLGFGAALAWRSGGLWRLAVLVLWAATAWVVAGLALDHLNDDFRFISPILIFSLAAAVPLTLSAASAAWRWFRESQ